MITGLLTPVIYPLVSYSLTPVSYSLISVACGYGLGRLPLLDAAFSIDGWLHQPQPAFRRGDPAFLSPYRAVDLHPASEF